MRYPFGLFLDSVKHLVGRKLRGERRFPLALTLHPRGIDTNGAGRTATAVGPKPLLSVAECLGAVEDSGAPVVVIGGNEPLEYPEISALTRAILKLRKHLFVCTDGALIRRNLHMIPPYPNFFWNVKLDGTADVHDNRAGRPGLFAAALDGIRSAKNAGFFVTVNTTIYPNTDVQDLEALYERLHGLHVDGYMLLPHYTKEKLCRDGCAKFRTKMQERFQEATERLGPYNLMLSPIYMEYLRGERDLDCSVWAIPAYGPHGWSGPCYLQDSIHAKTYKELLEGTAWENYGRGLDLRCENCLCPEGFESAAILGMNGKAGDWWKNLTWQFSRNLGEKREGKA
jgi:hopanoid biosynthesis associated radical SAM protein HpnH